MTLQQCIFALSMMLKSRYFEDKTEELFKAGLIHGTTHLANGQEASHVGLCMALGKNDWIVPTHRCHGFTIAKGSSAFAMFSEMLGSAHGLAKGLGGSMHMPDKKHCNLGSSAVVGSGVPLALGIAWYLQRQQTLKNTKDNANIEKNVSVAIFGDGATSRGSVHESMNIASIWNLPVLFYCENNHYGMSANSDDMVSVKSISERAKSYSMAGSTVDGNDIEAVYNECCSALAHIRSGKGPYLLEILTYRQKGHSKSDKRIYRTSEEENEWLQKDPIILFEKKLQQNGILSAEKIAQIKAEALSEIEYACEQALKQRNDCLTTEELQILVYGENSK